MKLHRIFKASTNTTYNMETFLCIFLIPTNKEVTKVKFSEKTNFNFYTIILEFKIEQNNKKLLKSQEWKSRKEHDCCLQIYEVLHYEEEVKVIFYGHRR